LTGQTFGVAFAVLLFVVEVLWIRRSDHGSFGATLATIMALYAATGWVMGAAAGVLSGLLATVFKRLVRDDGSVSGVGPFLGFLFMSMFIVRFESAKTLQTFPASVTTSLVAALLVWVGLGYLGRRFVKRLIPAGRRVVVLNLFALVAFFTVVGPLGISGMESDRIPVRTAQSATSPNVVLICVDALRPDHMSVYGYDRDTTPNLQRFADGATVFNNAYSHGNRTIIAMPSLFTGLYPSFHGAVGKGKVMIPLPESRTTMAQVCRDVGYTTVGAMSNVFLKTPYGLTKGFDRIEDFQLMRFTLSVYRALVKLGLIEKPPYTYYAPDATVVTDTGLEWLDRVKDGPFFLFLHYMDVHHPYTPPAEFETMFDTVIDAVDRDMLFTKTRAMVRNPPPLELPADELRRLVDLYDACIRYTDEEIGRFLYELESLDLERETVVIFTADHGDEFLDNGSLYHTNLAIEALIRVPLIVGRYPLPDAGRRVKSMVRHVDVLPTVAELVGGETPMAIHGGSFLPLLRGEYVPVAEYSIAEGDFCKSLNKGNWKIMYVDSTDSYQLFDLAADPKGLVDVSERYPRKTAELKAIVEDYLARVEELQTGEHKELSEDQIRELKALGYIQ
jgi:arylsulfatase A-like enzyme